MADVELRDQPRSSGRERGFTCYDRLPGISGALGQVKDVAVKLLRQHPELRHYNAVDSENLALRGAFPCQTPTPPAPKY